MFLGDMTSGGAIPMLEKTLAFTEARNRMLAENIANITTPGYRTQQLDVGQFQQALRRAGQKRADARRAGTPNAPLDLDDTRELRDDDSGRLKVTPSREPVENTLFHDGTNARIERQMSMLAENTIMAQVSSELLKGYYEGIQKAIRGRVV